MASSNRILSLDLGTQALTLCEFSTDRGGGLVLKNHRTTPLLGDPSVDATRHSQVGIAVSEMVESLKCRGVAVNYAVPAQSVFTRFVKLPSVGEEQADQIVAFEAQQNVPFPIDEVVWDYQLMEGGAAEVEVALVAIKADLLDDMNAAVEGAGVRTSVVDVSPMAIYNAFRYNYSDYDGCSLIIDVGARTTNLIFIEPGKVFSRSLPIGGTKITEAIAKDFNEPFGVAEERKKRDGFVGLGGAYADPEDPDVARTAKIIRNSMTRLHAEIARSISFYRSQQNGSAPGRILLCGGSVSLPYMREFFQEKLQLPVEFLNPLRNVAIAPSLNCDEIGRVAHTLGEAVGLALRGVAECPMELNLQPQGVIARQRLAKQTPYFVMASACILLCLGAWYLYLERAADLTRAAAAKIQQQAAPLREMQDRINAVRAEIKSQEDVVAPLTLAVSDRSYWVRLIDDINSRLPGELIWVVSFALQDAKSPEPRAAVAPPAIPGVAGRLGDDKAPTKVLLLKGLYLENPRKANVVDDFRSKLRESPLYEVKEDEFTRSLGNESEWASEYSVALLLKNPISSK
jgi:type IV pilus assembly protein PilM